MYFLKKQKQQEFIRREQEANARKVRKQLEQVESEKVAQGKQPFYIKKGSSLT